MNIDLSKFSGVHSLNGVTVVVTENGFTFLRTSFNGYMNIDGVFADLGDIKKEELISLGNFPNFCSSSLECLPVLMYSIVKGESLSVKYPTDNIMADLNSRVNVMDNLRTIIIYKSLILDNLCGRGRAGSSKSSSKRHHSLADYFNDWKSPSKEELEIFRLSLGDQYPIADDFKEMIDTYNKGELYFDSRSSGWLAFTKSKFSVREG